MIFKTKTSSNPPKTSSLIQNQCPKHYPSQNSTSLPPNISTYKTENSTKHYTLIGNAQFVQNALPTTTTSRLGNSFLLTCPHTLLNIMTPFITNINQILRGKLRKPEWKLIRPSIKSRLRLDRSPQPNGNEIIQTDSFNRSVANHSALLALRLSEYAQTLHYNMISGE